MDKVLEGLKYAAAGAGGLFAYLFGAWDALIIALVIFVVADYITGIAKAIQSTYNIFLCSGSL